MTQETLARIPRPHIVQRVAAAICPAPQRHWIQAMFAELAAIEGPGHRMSWMLGSAKIVSAAIEARARALLSLRMRIALVVALSVALACGILSYMDVQAILLDDELLAVLCVASVVTLFALASAAGRTIFRTPELTSNGGR